MGGSQSSIAGGSEGSEGYHVLKVRLFAPDRAAPSTRAVSSFSFMFQVQDGSPGQRAGLEAFFDFIVAIENTRLNQDNDTLKEYLKNGIDKDVKMKVYSSKTQTFRDVTIVPSTSWGGQGHLGVSIRFCSFEGANENVWHILVNITAFLTPLLIIHHCASFLRLSIHL